LLKRTERSLMHDKLAVVDDTVIATQNAENVLQIESKAIADHYAAYRGTHAKVPGEGALSGAAAGQFNS
jgi:hypothetical protein